MGKIKIGFIVLISLALVGLILSGVVTAKPENPKGEYIQDEIIVKFKGDTEPFRVIKVPKGQVIEKVNAYQQRAEVEYAEPNYLIFALGSNDTAYGNQWALDNTGQTIYKGSGNPDKPIDINKPIGSGTADADVDWEEAWSGFSASTSSDVAIAIVDSGIDESHPDLMNKIWSNSTEVNGTTGVDDDWNGYIDDNWGWDFVENDNTPHDVYGHGTHVSGIAAAETNNSIGIAGIAFASNIKIMPVQVLDDNGMGTAANVAKGIKYAADNGVKVINLSIGGGDSTTLKNAVSDAYSKGALLVAAAGNDGGSRKYYPASYPNVISVAATDYNDKRASFSNFNSEIDVSAPGVNVFSTFPVYPFTIGIKYGRSQNYDVGSGTSMSVPQVVGLAGLLFAQDDSRKNTDIRAIIEKTADDLGTLGWDKYFGWGRINVNAALNYVQPIPPPTPPPCIVVPNECNCNGKCGPNETTACADCQ